MTNKNYYQDNSKNEWDIFEQNPENITKAEAWRNQNSVNYWRHSRMSHIVSPLVQSFARAKWLTVGDGRYGSDAVALVRIGAQSVHASDLSKTLLEVAKKRGEIDCFSEEDAEKLTFSDDEFDFVYCKEAYHHFPRAYRALHEMFRVSKKGIVLIEPRDLAIDRAPLAFLFNIIKTLFFRRTQHDCFEPVGNYVYSISEREIKKFALGMGCKTVAFFSINDAYVPGVEYSDMNSPKLDDKILRTKIKLKIFLQDILLRFGLRSSGLLGVIIFKSDVKDSVAFNLRKEGWKVVPLPKNPYRQHLDF